MPNSGKFEKTECEINHLLLLEKIESIEETVGKLKKSLESRTDDISDLVEKFKQVQRIAEDAKRLSSEVAHTQSSIYEAMKNHIHHIDQKIVSFSSLIEKTSNDNKVMIEKTAIDNKAQTDNLNTKIDTLSTNLDTKIDALIESNKIEKALKDADEKRLDTFWKRLPVWLSFAVAIAGFVVWFINSMLIMYGKK